MWKPRWSVRREMSLSREVTMGGIRVKHWSNTMFPLNNHSIHVHSSLPLQCLHEFSSHHFNVSLCVHSYRTSINMLEPVWPDNVITTQRASNSHFLRTKWAILMLMRLSLRPKAHILFVHGTTKVKICLVTEKMKSKKSRCLRFAD